MKIILSQQEVYKIQNISEVSTNLYLILENRRNGFGLISYSKSVVQLYNHGNKELTSCCQDLIWKLQRQRSTGIMIGTKKSAVVLELCYSTAASCVCYHACQSQQASLGLGLFSKEFTLVTAFKIYQYHTLKIIFFSSELDKQLRKSCFV